MWLKLYGLVSLEHWMQLCVEKTKIEELGLRVLTRHLRHFYAADLLIKLHCEAGYMRKVSEVPEDSIY